MRFVERLLSRREIRTDHKPPHRFPIPLQSSVLDVKRCESSSIFFHGTCVVGQKTNGLGFPPFVSIEVLTRI